LPPISPGGDCGACVLSGLLGITVDAAYELQLEAADRDDDAWTPRSFTPPLMRDTLEVARWRDLVDRFVDQAPTWPDSGWLKDRCFGTHPERQSARWWEWLTMAFDAGYYAIAIVCMDGHGYYTPHSEQGRGGYNVGDHWLAIVGSRLRHEEKVLKSGTKCGQYHREILLSCSSTRTPDEEWVEAGRFIRERGGFHPFLIRPEGA
jgi:hypothetical protein